MADPRGYMTFKCNAAAASSQSSMRSFGNAVGKIGDLQVLNSIGGGKIGQGLRTIASVSNTIRSGCGSLPTSIGSTLESGANWVLDQTGIGSTVVDAVRGFNPGIANQAWGQAQQIFQKAKSGNFKLTDIPSSLQDLQNLERLGRNIFTPGGGASAGIGVDCLNSPYALDLIARAPKHKFMFVVAFTFTEEYSELMRVGEEMAFVIKKSTRPNIKFHSEDVNFYNFRTNIITRTEFEDMSMTFHDDMRNQSIQFYNAYRNAMSPITNMGSDDATGLIDPENSGLDFSNLINSQNLIHSTIKSNSYTAGRGPLVGDASSILKSVKLFHVYDGGRMMNVFQFINPRIIEMNLDELDMSSSEGNEVQIKFNYDSVYIHANIPANEAPFTDDTNALPGQQTGVMYPLRYNKSAGAMDAAHASVAPYGGQGATSSCDALGGISNGITSGGGVAGALSSLGDNLSAGVSNIADAASSIATKVTGAASDVMSSIFT